MANFFTGQLIPDFYAGAKDEMVFYPYPKMSELEKMNYNFFRAI